MIDTVRFKIPISREVFLQIAENSEATVTQNKAKQESKFKFLKNDIPIGSYSSVISIFTFDKDNLFLEFSLPKQLFGQNVYLIYPKDVTKVLNKIYKTFVEISPNFPRYETWQIVRIDLCYAWKFSECGYAEKMLKFLSFLEYPRKSKYLYPTSVMWRGREYSLKFYLKHEEFIKHDLPKLIKMDKRDYAHEIFELSQNVLRFEVTCRNEKVSRMFGNKEKYKVTIKDLLKNKKLINLLNKFLNSLLKKLDKKIYTDTEIIEKLKKIYKREKAIRLFQFYKQYHSKDNHIRKIIRSNYSQSTLWRNLNDLSVAKVGFSRQMIPIESDLSIPSPCVVSKAGKTAVAVPAAASQGTEAVEPLEFEVKGSPLDRDSA